MAVQNDLRLGVVGYPPVPNSGLLEVLSSWSGRGSLFEALAIPHDMVIDQRWSAEDLLKRANRVLYQRLVLILLRWPDRLNVWIDILPAARNQARVVRDTPFSGVSWPKSRIRYGWPPRAFTGRAIERRADMLLVTTLRWVLDKMASIRADALELYPDIEVTVLSQMEAAMALLEVEPIASALPGEPRQPELLALRREGAPWGAVAEVAGEIVAAEHSLLFLASQILLPDDAIRWRLFHLAVLGTLLCSLRALGCQIKSLHPLVAASIGPAYSVLDTVGREWELWFEASGVWSYSGIESPYVEATQGLSKRERALGADLLLMRRGASAAIFECKYSSDEQMVARAGYYQAVTYAVEIRSRLCAEVISVAIGPEGVVGKPCFTESVAGRVGISPPSGIEAIVREIVEST